MSKKLIGTRVIGDKTYEKDAVITDAEFEASGLDAADVVGVADAPAPAAAEVEASADSSAEHDSAPAPKAGEESASVGEVEPTVAHTITAEDLERNPTLVEEGLKVGDEIQLPAHEIVVDEAWLTANPAAAENGVKVGDKVLVAKEG